MSERKYSVGMDKKPMKKLGRPFNDPNAPRCVRVFIRVTEDERAMLKREAKRRGLTMTDLLLAPLRKGRD